MSDYTDDEKALIEATEWPTREESATADALIVHGARLAIAMHASNDVLMRKAFDLDRESPEYKPAMRAYVDGITSMIAEAQVVIALVQVQKTSREQADDVARMLWELTEDGGVLPELMFDYLTDRRIDANAMWALADKDATPLNRSNAASGLPDGGQQ